jgi:hypothetical protein
MVVASVALGARRRLLGEHHAELQRVLDLLESERRRVEDLEGKHSNAYDKMRASMEELEERRPLQLAERCRAPN